MTRLYLDIDGVLLTKRLTKAADHVLPFIEFVTTNFDCYWLTTHCKGDKRTALRYLEQYFDSPTIGKLESIKPTWWATLKTEALDLTSDFYWLDDNPFKAEIDFLKSHMKLDRLVIIDLSNEKELIKTVKCLLPSSVQTLGKTY